MNSHQQAEEELKAQPFSANKKMKYVSSSRELLLLLEAPYNIEIHTLVKHSPTVGCVKITTPQDLLLPIKNISLIVIADASGSMENGDRMANMRTGIMRLHELSVQFAQHNLNVELTVIRFSDSAKIIYGPVKIPQEEDEVLQRVCMELKPQGGTNIGMAIELALNIAEKESSAEKCTHMVLFTDGVDTSSLRTKLENKTAVFLQKLNTFKRLTFHSVGICSDADASLLQMLVHESSKRGTFQCIKDNDISKLISCMWGLMMEMVDENVRLIVEAHEADGSSSAIVSRDVILRICDPPIPLVVGFKVPQATTVMLRARMVIGDRRRCLETRLDLPRKAGPGFDMVCAKEAVNLLHGELSDKIVALLRAGNPANAIVEIGATRDVLKSLLEKTETAEQTTELLAVVDDVIKELDTSEVDMVRIINDVDQARDAELRAMSRSATARNSGVSIEPDAISLSALQRQLSE